MCKDLLYFGVEFYAVLSASLGNNLPSAERLDGPFEEFIRLKTYDKFVLFVDITCGMGGYGRDCFGVN